MAVMSEDCPKDIIEVRRNPDGTLDEIVAGDTTGDGLCVHLEQMDSGVWWLGISHRGYRQSTWFRSARKVTANSFIDGTPAAKIDSQS